MRYTGFLPLASCLLPLASCLLPIPCSLFPVPCSQIRCSLVFFITEKI
ncbi:hypothetical protein [Moorena producens]